MLWQQIYKGECCTGIAGGELYMWGSGVPERRIANFAGGKFESLFIAQFATYANEEWERNMRIETVFLMVTVGKGT